jgi:RimJ/RimL family protein N-acetyltransferase
MKIDIDHRIHLSEFRSSDKPAIVHLLRDREIYERTLRIPYPYTEADADAWLALEAETRKQQGQIVNWAIRNLEGELLGGIGFHDLELGKSHKAEIGYWLGKPFWRQGIVTAAVGRLCELAFSEWKLQRIQACIFPGNIASARVLEKCGFVKEGFLRKYHIKNGVPIDAELFATIR